MNPSPQDETSVNVFARIEAGLARRLRAHAAREGKLLRTVISEAAEAFQSLAEDHAGARRAIRAYTRLLTNSGRVTGAALQLGRAQREKMNRLASGLKVKKQVLYGAALMAYLSINRKKPKSAVR